MTTTRLPGDVDLSGQGIDPTGRVYRNPSTALLYSHALSRGDAKLAGGGSLVVDTGKFTGRSPKDKFLVDEPSSTDRIWWGEVNQKLAESSFDGLRDKVTAHLGAAPALYVVDAWAGADPVHRIGVRVVTAHPYHALFAKTMFIEPSPEALEASASVAAPVVELHTGAWCHALAHGEYNVRRAESEELIDRMLRSMLAWR